MRVPAPYLEDNGTEETGSSEAVVVTWWCLGVAWTLRVSRKPAGDTKLVLVRVVLQGSEGSRMPHGCVPAMSLTSVRTSSPDSRRSDSGLGSLNS